MGIKMKLMSSLSNYMQRRAVYKRTVNELSSLTDRELADLGIHRGMIRSIALGHYERF